MPTDTTARVVRRPQRATPRTVTADICVVGAGIAGVSAALEAARLGRRVVIVDAAPALGGQAIGSIIGTIIGLYTHGPSRTRSRTASPTISSRISPQRDRCTAASR